ncbi:MAG: pantoate--beta-alanine ligase [Thermoanaerobaculum sp.]|nr:pantoate--beta-alanine ligase [Thermoanaerobaculum sp.]
MLVVTTIAAVRARRHELWRSGHKVAFVPTMGALHEGHLTLVRRGRELADEVWVSVFVNPTQFGPGEDFARYPRTLERDVELLREVGASLVFAPSEKEMYPRPAEVSLTFPNLSRHLCGAHRPGHFAGVALVVSKLFNIVQPEVALFGAKDFQQAVLVQRLVEDLNFPVRLEVVPTVREADGLAMSSRNAYLDASQRQQALALWRALSAAQAAVLKGERSAKALEGLMLSVLGQTPGVRPQYVAAVDPETLEPVEEVQGTVLLALAAYVGSTRLIDNLLVEVPQ